MSSHREAPEISKDPVADSADLYAFVSPDKPDTVTIIANYIPLQGPDAGPNFFEFGDDVLYQINISTRGDAHADISYNFHFKTHVGNPETFLYNTGQITSLDSAVVQPASDLLRHQGRAWQEGRLSRDATCPARRATSDLGRRRTTPTSPSRPMHSIPGGGKVFAGQRADGFYVDLGSVFDLLDLRPFSKLHLIPGDTGAGVNSLASLNVHTIALQIPIKELTGGSGPDRRDQGVVGHRRLDGREPAALDDPRGRLEGQPRRLLAGLAPGQPARQRGRHPDGQEGLLEPHLAA